MHIYVCRHYILHTRKRPGRDAAGAPLTITLTINACWISCAAMRALHDHIRRVYVVHRVSSNLLGPVVPSS